MSQHVEQNDLPSGLAKPAQRALAGAGLRSMADISNLSESELSGLHGIGPKAVDLLRQAMKSKGLAFKSGK
ncbi:DNA-binding protein [Paenibacillus montanisoli]|uniref:DNA-binding protein n=1 Tax=Paenibacillus montanisoli TaxID=2081970 RepID=A0A328U018_9BACL|nr:DNA-binding protein [Paenibacillus montanisoli]RAP76138.1 DNA-binding protein [Paenibacillus montanisoli]